MEGRPNYAQLEQMGKLPKEARKFVPGLAENDEAREEIAQLKKENMFLKGVLRKHKIDLRKEKESKAGADATPPDSGGADATPPEIKE